MSGRRTNDCGAQPGRQTLLVVALLTLAACSGDREDDAPATPAPVPTASAVPAPPAAPAPAAGPAAPATAEGSVKDAGVDTGVAVLERPAVTVPPYEATAPNCEPHPELALAAPISVRDLERGVPEYPMVDAVNATCQRAPAEVAASFNRGGLRRHRQRDYGHSQHYFGQALVADPSQLAVRFNLACALARQDLLDEAIVQLTELSGAGAEGAQYAARAHTDADFGAYHNTPALAALVRGLPEVVEALPSANDQVVHGQGEIELRGSEILLDGERVWQSGVLDAATFQDFVLGMEPERRRFQFYAERPSDSVTAAVRSLGLQTLTRHAAWSPDGSHGYVVVPVSSRDEVRHTLYLAQVLESGSISPLPNVELPQSTCAEGVEPVAVFVATPDHRAFGYVVGCLDAAPQTFERCLYYFQDGNVRRRCGRGAALSPAEPAAAASGSAP